MPCASVPSRTSAVSQARNQPDLWTVHLEERLRQVGDRASFQEALVRKRAAKLLFAGSVSGFLGFLFALIVGVITEQTAGQYDLNGAKFRSGRGYFPSTVSEMVHDPSKPEGKIFFAFCFVGAIFIFFSWYPAYMRNVYIGDDAVACFGVSWITCRQFVPAPGMMMLSIITTVPAAQAGATDFFCVALHLVGAAMLFVGYFITEAHCVGWFCCKSRVAHHLCESRKAIHHRRLCLTAVGVFYVIFCVLQVVLSVGEPLIPKEANDKWGHLAGHKGVQLLDTATWRVKLLKVASYISEVVCGLFLLGSHLLIWYHCEERHYDLPEQLDALNSRIPLDLVDRTASAKEVGAMQSMGDGTGASAWSCLGTGSGDSSDGETEDYSEASQADALDPGGHWGR